MGSAHLVSLAAARGVKLLPHPKPLRHHRASFLLSSRSWEQNMRVYAYKFSRYKIIACALNSHMFISQCSTSRWFFDGRGFRSAFLLAALCKHRVNGGAKRTLNERAEDGGGGGGGEDLSATTHHRPGPTNARREIFSRDARLPVARCSLGLLAAAAARQRAGGGQALRRQLPPLPPAECSWPRVALHARRL
jgi:hypothetical protein